MLESSLMPSYSRLSFSTVIEILQIICGLVDLVNLRIVLGRLVFLVHLSSPCQWEVYCLLVGLFVSLHHCQPYD